MITAYHPQANGAAERTVQTTSTAIYKLLEGRDIDWDLFTPSIQYFTNMKVSQRHGSTPYSLLFARQANELKDYSTDTILEPLHHDRLKERLDYMSTLVFPAIATRTKNEIKKMAVAFDKQTKVHTDAFLPGAIVMAKNEMRSSKSEERYTGPFTVKRRSASGPYVLVDQMGNEFTRPRSSLKLVKNGQVSSTDRLGVKCITDERKDADDRWEYLVQWDHPTAPPQWVKSGDFDDYSPIRAFFKKQANKDKEPGNQ